MVSPAEIREGAIFVEGVLERYAPEATAAARRLLTDAATEFPRLANGIKEVNEGLLPAKSFWDGVTGHTFETEAKPAILKELSNADESYKFRVVRDYAHRFLQSEDTGLKVVTTNTETLPRVKVANLDGNVEVVLPSSLSPEKKSDTMLGAIFGHAAERDHLIAKYPELVERRSSYYPGQWKDTLAEFLKGGAEYVAGPVRSDSSTVARVLTKEFGYMHGVEDKMFASKILESGNFESKWSPVNLVKDAGLEPTPANLAAASNMTLLQLSPASRGLGIELLGKQGENAINSSLNYFRDNPENAWARVNADLAFNSVRKASAKDLTTLFRNFGRDRAFDENRAISSNENLKSQLLSHPSLLE